MKIINRFLTLNKKSGINIFVNQEKVGMISESGEMEFDTPNREFELSFSTHKTHKNSKIFLINNHRIDRGVVEVKFILRLINIMTFLFLSIDFVFGDLIFNDTKPIGIDNYIAFGLFLVAIIFNFIIFKNNYFDARFYDEDSQLISVDQYPYRKK